MNHHITRHDTPDDPSSLKLVDDGIGDYNEAVEPRLAEVRHPSCFARDAAERVVGGAVGRTWGNNAELQQIWLPASLRSHQLGSKLLLEFEAGAIARGCNLLYLETWSFQARGFYEKRGFEVACEISGYAAGVSKFTMTKSLAGEKVKGV